MRHNKHVLFLTIFVVFISIIVITSIVSALTTISTNITTDGNLTVSGSTTLNGVSYSWPSSLTASNFLTTDSSGNLSWGQVPDPGWIDSGTIINLSTSSDRVGIGYTDNAAGAKLTVNGNVGIGTTNPTTALTFGIANSTTTFIGGGGIATTGNNDFYIDAGSGTVVIGGGAGKLDAGTIDPVYSIGDTSYATYVASMVGIKEEITGVVKLQASPHQSLFIHIIDFNSAQRGSDNWLFERITDWGTDMEDLVVLLSSAYNAEVSYIKDPINNRVILYGDCVCEVSYRLTAPRFDHAEWSNIATNQGGGFAVPDVVNDPNAESASIDYGELADTLEN